VEFAHILVVDSGEVCIELWIGRFGILPIWKLAVDC